MEVVKAKLVGDGWYENMEDFNHDAILDAVYLYGEFYSIKVADLVANGKAPYSADDENAPVTLIFFKEELEIVEE
jgi:hypothetical protein